MRIIIFSFFVVISVICTSICISGCGSKNSSGTKSFCDTVCQNDSLKFISDSKLNPYLYISFKSCLPDTIIWSYKGSGTNRKIGFSDLLNSSIRVNKNYLRCFIKDTSFVLMLFNDCLTGRGYQVKLPFDKKSNISKKSSGINNFDHKFSVADDLIAYTDRGNIFVEDITTGKKEMMTFGKATDINYDVIHETIDSVNITPARIWVKVKIDGEWKVLEKNITLK